MDEQRFDRLARVLGSGLTRRGAVRTALAGLAAATGLAAVSEADARKKGKKASAQRKGKEGDWNNNNGFCRGECWDDDDCRRGGPPNSPPAIGGFTGGGPDNNSSCRCVRQGGGFPGNDWPSRNQQGGRNKGQCKVCSCHGKKCGESDDCGGYCGGWCPEKQICVKEHDGKRSCKASPVCSENGQQGLCCSGHKCNDVCCNSTDAGAVAIEIDVDLYNQITVTTAPVTVTTTIASPPAPPPAPPPATVIGGGGRRRRRRRRRRGGRRR